MRAPLGDICRINREIDTDSQNLLWAAKQAGLGYTNAKLNADNKFLVDLERSLRGACAKNPDLY